MAGPIRISILGDASSANRAFSSASSNANTMGSRVGKAGKALGVAVAAGAAVAGAAALKFGVDSVKSASDAQQSLGATETVFGKYAQTVIKRSDQAATAIGISANEYRELSNVVGASLRGVGFPLEQTANLTDNLNRRAADMAATFGGTTKDAVEAISSLMRGEADPIERYGVSIKAVDVAARLAANGQDELTGAALKQAEMQARLDLLFQKTAITQGAFAKESGTLAHQQQVLGAQFEDLKVKVGNALLPVITDLFTFLNTDAIPALTAVGGYLQDNFGPAFERVQAAVKGFLDGSGGEVTGWAADIKSTFTSLVSIVTTLWNTFGEDIVRYTTTSLKNLKQIIGGGLDVIAGIFKTISALLKGDWRGAWDGIKQITSGAKEVLAGVVKQLFNILQTVVSVGWKAIKGLFSAAWDGIKELVGKGVDKVVEFVEDLPGRITSVVSGAFDGLKEAFRSAINFIIDGWNGLSFSIPGFDPPGPGPKFDGFTIGTPNIPRLARGGITTGPTLALVGDNPGGREAVIPLDRYDLSGGAQLVPLLEQLIEVVKTQTKSQRADTQSLAGVVRQSNREAATDFGRVINGAASDGRRRAAR